MSRIPDYTVVRLARFADCFDPDGPDSPGARFLRSVADAARDILAYPDATDLDALSSEITAAADACVPVYAHDRWATFVDVGAYVEDPTELVSDPYDMGKAASICLYIVAERLLSTLIADAFDPGDDGYLYNASDAAPLGPATPEQAAASRAQAAKDGGSGIILVDESGDVVPIGSRGRAVYVL